MFAVATTTPDEFKSSISVPAIGASVGLRIPSLLASVYTEPAIADKVLLINTLAVAGVGFTPALVCNALAGMTLL